MKYPTLLLLVIALSGCSRSTADPLAPVKSPNGSLTVTPSINQSKADPTKYLCVALDIADSSGKPMHHVQSGASDRMKWAIGWFDDSTVVLYSSDIGTRAWELRNDKGIHELDQPLPPDLAKFGDQLKADKYER
jgi:hypothetical protein